MSGVPIPKRVSDRLKKAIPPFQEVLAAARDRDVNESDTVLILTDVLADVLGYDKYTEITSEQAIRGTYCDLAVRVGGAIQYLIEAKAIGLTLKESHLRQAVNYGANQGIPWVVLTNGITWEIYRVKFERPVDYEMVATFNFLELDPRSAEQQSVLFLLCREGCEKSAIERFHEHLLAVNRFMVGAILQSDDALKLVRRELRRVAPDAKVSVEEIRNLLPEVLKRDVLEGKAAGDAARKLKRATKPRTVKSAPAATGPAADGES